MYQTKIWYQTCLFKLIFQGGRHTSRDKLIAHMWACACVYKFVQTVILFINVLIYLVSLVPLFPLIMCAHLLFSSCACSFIDLPNTSASIYSAELCNRLRAFLIACPPSSPSPPVADLLIATADFQRDLDSWNIW